MRTYTELIQLPDFYSRFEYLKLDASIGDETFGFDRYLNQTFYHSAEWKRIRRDVIVRDMGCDLGVPGEEIAGRILIHHMNPITIDDVLSQNELLLNPEYLICVSHETHNAIHYGTEPITKPEYVERRPNDTCPWKH